MDLFVINRYNDINEEGNEEDQEIKHLNNLKKKIEERKRANAALKKPEPQEITIKQNVETNDLDNDINDKKLEDNILETSLNTKIEDEHQQKDAKDIKIHKEFKVLGINEFEKKAKVKRVLPHWLANPFSVPTSLRNLNSKVDSQVWIHPTIKSTLINEGITHLFPVQEKVIPFVLQQHKLPAPLCPRDICVSVPTGSGKTLSFVLPIIQVLMHSVGRYVRALIVLPVQELASQVAKVFRKYCTNTGLRIALLSGSTPLTQEQKLLVRYTESTSWVSEVDIIVCTAGRLVEHIQNTEGFSLKHLKFLVIDEADRIMDHIQNDWLYHLDRHIKLQNQVLSGKTPNLNWANLHAQRLSPHKLLFSATLSQDPEKLEQWALFQPKLFSAAAPSQFEDDEHIRMYTTPAELTEKCVISEAEEKPLILYHLLVEEKWNRILCFTNASQSAHRLTVLLNSMGQGEFSVAELSAALDRTTRETVLKQFQQNKINILIGTDALARGIDIPDCDYVISYDLPRNIKTYIHRVGRTGRAGRKGCAVTMLLQNQMSLFKEILQAAEKNDLPHLNIPEDIFDKFSSLYHNAIYETKNHIHDEIQAKVQKSISLKRPKRTTKRTIPNENVKNGSKIKY